MEEPRFQHISSCDICGGHETKVKDVIRHKIYPGEVYEQCIIQCENCGFVWAENPYSDHALEDLYSSRYSDDTFFAIPDASEGNKRKWIRQKHFIEEGIGEIPDHFSVMEIGAGTGYNLSNWKKHGPVFAVEPSLFGYRAITEKYKVDCFHGTFQQYINSNVARPFDLIICAHVLEHIVHPDEFVRTLRGCVHQYVYMEVPVINLRQADGCRGVFVYEHVNYFTETTLQRLMLKHGFSLIKIYTGDWGDKRTWGKVTASLWKRNTEEEKNAELPVNLDGYTDFDTVNRYIAEDNAKAEGVAHRFAAIDKAERIGLYNVSSSTAKKLLARFDFSSLNIVKVYDDDRRCDGEELFGIRIKPFDLRDLENGIVDKIVIMNSNYQSFIVNDFISWGFGDRVITLF